MKPLMISTGWSCVVVKDSVTWDAEVLIRFIRLCARSLVTRLHSESCSADVAIPGIPMSPSCSHLRATASEDNAALGSLQASPQELLSSVGSGIVWTRTGDLQAIGRILYFKRSAFTRCANW
ncbi:UNVERIFIED_CONTAM: hypothetical protein FKN15_023842 [Acipenser sinensis]